MVKKVTVRRARFLKLLKQRGLSQAGWAREHDISPAHLSLVLNGKRESDVLLRKIEAYAKSA